MQTVTITNGDGAQNKKVVFLDGGMSARDWISISTALYVIDQLVESFEENKDLLKNYDWVVMPLTNPDGYEFSRSNPSTHLWVKTRKPYGKYFGANLSKNFPFMFDGLDSNRTPSDECYSGPYPFSEPEAAAMGSILLSLQGKLHFYLSLHAFGNRILYPWGYDSVEPVDVRNLFTIANTGAYAIHLHSGTKYRVGGFSKTLYPSSGGSMDYAYAVCNAKFAMTMYLPSGTTGYDPLPSSIRLLAEESWIGIARMVDVSELYQ